MTMVWPSGAARAASAVPMVPIAPGLFSMTNAWPSASCSGGASERAIWSGRAPGGKGTMKRTGLPCANAAAEIASSRAATSERMRLSCINGGRHGHQGTEGAGTRAAPADVRRRRGRRAHECDRRVRPSAAGHHQRLRLWRHLEPRRARPQDTQPGRRSEEHTSELQSHVNLVCRLLLEKKKK